eukprot:TRINITY_DN14652_c0_g1_i1.p1 TRINITY_DN14652_c0_g1~~TRINITY_DN14652_c0_g1_i1.p1  ORF type:complete len:115 (-),score=8.96 TRINITY_DN14652_c0_g1_i1:155-499(-)
MGIYVKLLFGVLALIVVGITVQFSSPSSDLDVAVRILRKQVREARAAEDETKKLLELANEELTLVRREVKAKHERYLNTERTAQRFEKDYARCQDEKNVLQRRLNETLAAPPKG